MKISLIALFSLLMIAVVVSQAEEDLMASENLLKIIEKKIFKWIKKCRKHGGCLFDDDYEYDYAPSYGGYGHYPTYNTHQSSYYPNTGHHNYQPSASYAGYPTAGYGHSASSYYY